MPISLDLENFLVLDKITATHNCLVIRAIRKKDRERVILKRTESDHPTLDVIAGFHNENQFLTSLSHPGIIRPLDFFREETQWFLVLEDVNGITLKQHLHRHSLPLQEFYKIALQLTTTLIYIHSKNIIHNDLKPDNILITPEGNIKIIDFSIASELIMTSHEITPSSNLQGTLEYLSPEQTGRTNRSIDSRSDLYSLGVTFFEMLTGRPPFINEDPLELIYSHLAKPPPEVLKFNPMVPTPLSQMILKLMAKSPEDRYQTATGILHDLEICAQHLSPTAGPLRLVLAQKDTPSKLQISTKIYGRDKQLETLRNVIEDINDLQAQFVFISGYSGIGKSSLIREIQPMLIFKRCLLLEGKFDQMEHNVPYFGIIHALKKFCRELLGESELEINRVKEAILKGVGGQGQVMVNLVPELEWIIGKQPHIPDLSPTESQNRFNIIIKQFFQSLATIDHPLVIFLDDLMWADLASLTLIETMFPSMQNVVFIGAYRSNELDQLHPLVWIIHTLKESKCPLYEIYLNPLEFEDISALLKDTFGTNEVNDLGQLVLQKTAGNPFFVKELLRFLETNHSIQYNTDKGHWDWNIETIKKQNITQNVVELMADKIKTLSEKARSALSIAAALGAEFDLKVLSQVLQKEEGKVGNDLSEALNLDMINISRKVHQQISLLSQGFTTDQPVLYSFSHDRIQQAAYEQIPKHELPFLHLRIAKLGQALDLEELVGHYNQAWQHITDEKEKRQVIRWNIDLAKKAKSSTAHQSALDYLQAAERLAKPICTWESDSLLFYELYREKAECLCMVLHFAQAEELFGQILAHTQDRELQASIYCLKAKLYCRQDRLQDGITEGCKGLALYHVHFPKKITKLHILYSILKIKVIGFFKDVHSLEPMTDPDAIMISELLSVVFLAAYQSNPELFMLICAKGVEVVLKNGYTKSLISIIIASFLFLVIHDFKTADIYYKLTFELNEKMKQADDWGFVLAVSGGFIDHWFAPFKKSIETSKKGILLALESGSFFWSTGGSLMLAFSYFRTGLQLNKFETVLESNHQEFLLRKRAGFLEMTTLLKDFVKAIKGAAKLDLISVDEQLASLKESKNESLEHAAVGTLCIYYYLMQDYVTALKYAKMTHKKRPSCTCSVVADLYDLFSFLTFAKQNKYSSEMKTILKDTKSYAAQNPKNFAGNYSLMLGEVNRIQGNSRESHEYYDQAISHFQAEGWSHFVAVADELTFEAYSKTKRSNVARFYLKEAHYHYTLWGAKAKVEQMELNYPDLFREDQSTIPSIDTSKSMTPTSPGMIDFLSVLHSSQAISQEIATDRLMDRIMGCILANTGAQRGVILLEKRDTLYVEAESLLAGDTPHTKDLDIPFKEFSSLPHSMIAYVYKSHEIIVMNGPDSTFYKDTYFKGSDVKAALCIPIRHKGKDIGVLYLEHTLNVHAFNITQLQTLNLIITQAAISLENSRLYAAYKRFVPSELLKNLNRDNVIDVTVGDHVDKNMTVLFADIRGFTIMSETLSPHDVFELINQFLGHCSPIVRKRGGFVDKYIGDAIMALFPGSVDDAIFAALEILETIESLNVVREGRGETPIHLGIGINTGPLTLGIIGEEQRFEGSVLGDTVNIASHLETLNKVYGTSILISGDTKRKLSDSNGNYLLYYIDEVQLKGKKKSVEIWRIEGNKT